MRTPDLGLGLSSRDRIFGSSEVKSTNLSAFTKWNVVLRKSSRISFSTDKQWVADLAQYEHLPLQEKINKVNAYVNGFAYIEDNNNWNKSDYWATPAEFFARGGDCEDFAFAKYSPILIGLTGALAPL